MNTPDSCVSLLLLDDHAAVSRQVKAILPSEFQVVEVLTEGSGLMAALEKYVPQIVVLDITLPGPSGIELAALIRRAKIPCKIVFLTVHQDPDYVQAAFTAGADGYVVKSHLVTDLVPALHAVLASQKYGAPENEHLPNAA